MLTPEEIEAENKKYNEFRLRNNEKIRNFFLNHPEWQLELADCLQHYYDEYGIECFDSLDLEF